MSGGKQQNYQLMLSPNFDDDETQKNNGPAPCAGMLTPASNKRQREGGGVGGPAVAPEATMAAREDAAKKVCIDMLTEYMDATIKHRRLVQASFALNDGLGELEREVGQLDEEIVRKKMDLEATEKTRDEKNDLLQKRQEEKEKNDAELKAHDHMFWHEKQKVLQARIERGAEYVSDSDED